MNREEAKREAERLKEEIDAFRRRLNETDISKDHPAFHYIIDGRERMNLAIIMFDEHPWK